MWHPEHVVVPALEMIEEEQIGQGEVQGLVERRTLEAGDLASLATYKDSHKRVYAHRAASCRVLEARLPTRYPSNPDSISLLTVNMPSSSKVNNEGANACRHWECVTVAYANSCCAAVQGLAVIVYL